jgi:8-oxo-dGTP diphosphatase
MMKKRIRAVGIVIKDGSILLMHRVKKDFEYWTFAGGGVEENETVPEAVARELMEETSIKVRVGQLFDIFMNDGSNKYPTTSEHHFYLCEYISGTPKLGSGPEQERADNTYDPQWVPLEQFEKLDLYASSTKNKIMDHFKSLSNQ